jgi:iron complex outermembrane receptor protein
MIDGQPVSFRPSQEVWLGEELIPIEAIERIEVIKGPASVLYGANAYLGVINIITKMGESVRNGEIGARFGFGEHLSDPGGSGIVGVSAGRVDALGALGAYSPALTGYQLVPVPGEMSPLANERSQSGHPLTGSGFAKLQVRTSDVGRLTLDFLYERLDRYTEFMDWGLEAHDNRQSLYNLYSRARYTTTFKDVFDVRVAVAVSNGAPLATDHLNVAANLPTYVQRDVGYWGYDAFSDLSWRIGKVARVSAGADLTLDDQQLLAYYTVAADGTRTLNPPAATPTGGRTFTNFGGYLHGVLTPFADSTSERWRELTLVGGVRFDQQNIYGSDLNYDAGIVHQFTKDLYGKLLYGTSFRAPSGNQLYSNFIDTLGVIGNPNLRPERARTAEATVGGAIGSHVAFEATGFFTRIDSKVEIRPDPGAATTNPIPQNLAQIQSAGFEAGITASVADLSSYLNYSFERSTSMQPNPFSTIPGATVTTDTLLYPMNMLKFGITYRLAAARLRANLEGRYIGRRLDSESNNEVVYGIAGISTNRYAVDGYFLMNLFLSSYNLELWKGHETRLGLKVTNLLDTTYAFPGYNGFDIPGFARTFYLTLSQCF